MSDEPTERKTVLSTVSKEVAQAAIAQVVLGRRLQSDRRWDPLRCRFSNRITRSDPSVTDYILEVPAKCPNCRREILEKTLV